jgi:hypothetical protein
MVPFKPFPSPSPSCGHEEDEDSIGDPTGLRMLSLDARTGGGDRSMGVEVEAVGRHVEGGCLYGACQG